MSYKTDLQDNNTDLQNILNKVNTLPDATVLPTLSNPASTDIIPSGYEAIDASGSKITGTGSGLGNATAADVTSGKTFTSSAGLKVVGTSNAKQILTRKIYTHPNNGAYGKVTCGLNNDEIPISLVASNSNYPPRLSSFDYSSRTLTFYTSGSGNYYINMNYIQV